MKKLILLVLLLPLLAFGQNEFFRNDVISDRSDGFAYYTAETDSVFFYEYNSGDTLWLAGPDSIHIYLPAEKTLGKIKIKGSITGTIWLNTTRHGVAANRRYSSGNVVTAIFKIRPHAIVGTAGDLIGIWFEIEYLQAY